MPASKVQSKGCANDSIHPNRSQQQFKRLGVMFTDNGQNMTSLQGHSKTKTSAPSSIKGSQGHSPSNSHSLKIYVSDFASAEQLPHSQPVLPNSDNFLAINMAVGVGETLVVPVRVHKVEEFATIDSAAQVSIINTMLFKQLPGNLQAEIVS